MSASADSVTLGERTVNGRSTLTAVNSAVRRRRYGAAMHAARPVMDEPLKDRNLLSLADLGPAEVSFVLGLAGRLQAAHATGTDEPLLRGRIVGVLGDGPVDPAFAAAVQELGASVAAVSPGLMATGEPARLERTAQWLGRLYDAIDVADLALAVRLARHSRVPVFGGLSSPQHSFGALGERLAPQQGDARVALVKALLVATLR
jgi:ornithine carbamoyltransferase